ncbi:hypothetical protein CRUP_019959 [Coryphaenoides rupestris]|nr:hypothetical protein CRUP_019959 [Coryphaenoides rupestris]
MAASVMSMPASLAISKLFWPETETPSDPGEVKASRGVIAFISILAFLDGSLSWLGGLFDYPQLSFMLICSYAFAPLAFMMGVSWEDSFLVGELIGIKTFFNELLGYERMSELSMLREAGEPEYVDTVTANMSAPLNTTAAALQRCCAAAPSTFFNCSAVAPGA